LGGGEERGRRSGGPWKDGVAPPAGLKSPRISEHTHIHTQTHTHTSCTTSRGFGWRIHCGVEITELSTNKHHSLAHCAAMTGAKGDLRKWRRELIYLRCCLFLQNEIQSGSREEPTRYFCDGQTSLHTPRLVVSHNTCPPLSPSSLANSFIIGTAVINNNFFALVLLSALAQTRACPASPVAVCEWTRSRVLRERNRQKPSQERRISPQAYRRAISLHTYIRGRKTRRRTSLV
jgi:hypothetical protein